jgi:predicted alpha/beta hydrolase
LEKSRRLDATFFAACQFQCLSLIFSMAENINVLAWDGYPLSATSFTPHQSNGRVLLLVNSIAQRQSHYREFCQSFSDFGFQSYSFDFRGIGESRNKTARELDCDLKDWAVLDLDAMVSYIMSNHPGKKMTIVFHGSAAVLAGISRLSKRADSIVMVGSSSPFARNIWNSFAKSVVSKIVAPACSLFLGYIPLKVLGLGEDLPDRVAAHWLKWATSFDAIFENNDVVRKDFEQMEQRALLINFSDDRSMTSRSTENLLALFPRLRAEVWSFSPEQVVHRHVGHSGFFRKSMKAVLWNDMIRWIGHPQAANKSKAA